MSENKSFEGWCIIEQMWECPCGQWAYLDEDQWAGRVSVDHAADGCPKGYHETHEFGKALLTTIQAAILCGESPVKEDEASR